jgi:hypothetical protein
MRKLLNKIGWYSLKEGVTNLIRWVPVIWRDRDFDEHYLYVILHKKLENMENFFRSEYAYTACANETADQIEEAKDIVQRLIDDAYFTDLVEHIDTTEMFSFDKSGFKTITEHPQYKEWSNACELSDKLRQDDKNRLFEIMRDKIDGWWD